MKSSDGASNYWSQFSPSLVAAVHALGLNICAWQYVYGSQPAGEAALGLRAVRAGADCLVIDAESEYAGKYAAAQTYIDDLREALGPRYPIGLASFPYVDYHESEPYSVFLAAGGAQYDVPQIYWHAIGGKPRHRLRPHLSFRAAFTGGPIVPLGQLYGSVHGVADRALSPGRRRLRRTRVLMVGLAVGVGGRVERADRADHRPHAGDGDAVLAGARPARARRSGGVAAGVSRRRRAADPHQWHLRRRHGECAGGVPDIAGPAADR